MNRRQRQAEFARLQTVALLSAITGNQPSDEVQRRIREMAANGVDERDIAARLGLSIDLVRRALGVQNEGAHHG